MVLKVKMNKKSIVVLLLLVFIFALLFVPSPFLFDFVRPMIKWMVVFVLTVGYMSVLLAKGVGVLLLKIGFWLYFLSAMVSIFPPEWEDGFSYVANYPNMMIKMMLCIILYLCICLMCSKSKQK